MILTFDFHNHSCLSPCASLENAPSAMAARAALKGLDLFALTDHNSALNAPAFAIACARVGLIPLFGLEINPFEEAHLLAIFPDPLLALAFSDWVVQYLPQIEVAPSQFGDQVVVDPEDEILAMPSAWYGNSLLQSFTFLRKRRPGQAPLSFRPMSTAHSSRSTANWGFCPKANTTPWKPWVRSPDKKLCGRHCVISGSDAHVPEHIGRRASTVEIGSEQLADDLRLGLAEMFRTWNGLSHRQELGQDSFARTLQPGAEADEVMCGARTPQISRDSFRSSIFGAIGTARAHRLYSRKLGVHFIKEGHGACTRGGIRQIRRPINYCHLGGHRE